MSDGTAPTCNKGCNNHRDRSDEFDATAPSDYNSDANTVAENAAADAAVGVTASSSDADGSTVLCSQLTILFQRVRR